MLITVMVWAMQVAAQQDHFIFIRSEKSQPFYVRLQDRNLSSSAIGHIILSKLKDSTYNIVIGFPKNQFPEQEFSVPLNHKDRGFELKDLGGQGWALFDLQSLQLIQAAAGKPQAGGGGSAYGLVKKSDDFARLMAGVVNDTAVLYTFVAQAQPQPQPEPVVKNTVAVPKEEPADSAQVNMPAQVVTAPVVRADSVQQKAAAEPPVTAVIDTVQQKPAQEQVVENVPGKTVQDTARQVVNADSVAKDVVFDPPALPVIQVLDKKITDSGYHLTITDGQQDTIVIFIPLEKVTAQQEKEVAPLKDTVAKQPAQADTVMKNMQPVAAADTVQALQKEPKKLVMMNSDCRNFATSADLDKLRVKLLQEKDAPARINAAKKVFKTRCFSAQQVKALTELFPLDETKYDFLEAAYPFVSDTGNFKELVGLFDDPMYVQRFRRLVRLD